MIDQSGKSVAEGTELSQEVGKSLEGIVAGISDTTASMDEISGSTSRQADTARDVTKSVGGISAVVEENSASAEEMAASAEELSAQAQRLQGLIGRFQLSAGDDGLGLGGMTPAAAPLSFFSYKSVTEFSITCSQPRCARA